MLWYYFVVHYGNKVLMKNLSHDKSMKSLFNNKSKSHDMFQCC